MMHDMQPDHDVSRDGEAAEASRKPYRKPRLEDYGSVVELTGAGSGTTDDGGGSFSFSGSSG